MKKFLKNNGIKILTVVLFFSSIPFNISLADKEQEKAKEIMQEWNKRGILAGDGAGNFRPNDPVSRAEFMVLTNRALKFENKTASINNYRDIKKNDWYYDDIRKAISVGYISGISKDKISPNSKITNQEVYAAISKLIKEDSEVDLNFVLDKESISKWAEKGIKKSIANGYALSEDGKINPKKYTSRADVIVILDRVMTNQRVISFPGTYTIKSAKTISVLSDKVILKDTVIEQDLILGANVTEIIIQNSQIKGKLIKNNTDTKVTKDGLSKFLESEIKEDIKKQLEDKELKDGSYEGIAQGYGGQMLLRVTVKNGKITDITFLSHNETGSYLELAERVTKKIIEAGGTDKVDTISGATVSSKAIINAVNDALSQAKGKTQRAGQTPDSYEQISTGKKKGKTPTEPNKIDYSKKDLKDGVYKGSATGYGGKITVSVHVKKGKISDVLVDSHSETGSYYKQAEVVLKKITDKNGTNVDTISGATVTSKGILSAVEDALLKASGGDKVEKTYADGTWYGQGRGHYSQDQLDDNDLKTATEAEVIIKNGKIISAKMVYNGDDHRYERPKGYSLIEKYIIEKNNTQGITDIFAKRDGKEPIFDAVSGATNSARGFVSAIEDALNRSQKFNEDGVLQEVRSINLEGYNNYNIKYDKEADLSRFNIIVKYLDGKEEKVKFSEIESKGIKCNLPIKFMAKPDNNNYGEKKNFELIFTHEKSTSKHVSQMFANRESKLIKMSKIIIKDKNGKIFEIPISENEFRYNLDLGDVRPEDLTEIIVLDLDSNQVSLDKPFEIIKHKKPTAYVELKPLDITKPEDPISLEYKFRRFVIEFNVKDDVIKHEFNKNNIISFSIQKQPIRKEYEIGDVFNLNGLEIVATDNNGVNQVIYQYNMNEYNFESIPKVGDILNQLGEVAIKIKHNDKVDESFKVNVKDKALIPASVTFTSKDGMFSKNIELIQGEQYYYDIEIPESYKGQKLTPVVRATNGDIMSVHNLGTTNNTNPQKPAKHKIWITEYDFINFTFKYI